MVDEATFIVAGGHPVVVVVVVELVVDETTFIVAGGLYPGSCNQRQDFNSIFSNGRRHLVSTRWDNIHSVAVFK